MHEPLTAERLFHQYFAPLYPPEALADLANLRTIDANPGKNKSIYVELLSAAKIFCSKAPEVFQKPDLSLDFSDASIHRIGILLTRELREAWIASGSLVQVVTHGSLYVSACAVRNHGGEWLVRRPLWESRVRLESKAGVSELAMFQWWLKALSDEELGIPRLVDRYRTHVEVPTFNPDLLDVVAPADRVIPRLSKVRYDLLYKHVRAHLPELKDFGINFPSPERFEDLGFRYLDFLMLGGGRMLLMHGPGRHGVHLMWLEATGFQKAAYYPSDPTQDYKVEVHGDFVRVTAPIQNKPFVHDMLWWGV